MSLFSAVLPDRAAATREAREEEARRAARQAAGQAFDTAVGAKGPVSPGHVTPHHQVLDLRKARDEADAILRRCEKGLREYPGHPLYVNGQMECKARLEWLSVQESAQASLQEAFSARKAAGSEVARLQASVSDLEAKLAVRRDREASNQAALEGVTVEIGAAECDGKPTADLRKRLAALQSDLQVDSAVIATLADRLSEPAAAFSAAKQRLADADAEHAQAEQTFHDFQLRQLTGRVVALIVDAAPARVDQGEVWRRLQEAWNPGRGFSSLRALT